MTQPSVAAAEYGKWFLSLVERETGFWAWIEEVDELDMRRANKFMLGSLLDFQIKAERAWENARRLAEDLLGDPDGLWHSIASVPSQEWDDRRPAYRLHRFHWVHSQVHKTAVQMVGAYSGDARRVWCGQPPSTVQVRLKALGLGDQRSRMAVGALIDTSQIEGTGDVKADIHVKRVLGRILEGSSMSEAQATHAARSLSPQNPWLVDRPAYLIGKEFCAPVDPRCAECPAAARCCFKANR